MPGVKVPIYAIFTRIFLPLLSISFSYITIPCIQLFSLISSAFLQSFPLLSLLHLLPTISIPGLTWNQEEGLYFSSDHEPPMPIPALLEEEALVIDRL